MKRDFKLSPRSRLLILIFGLPPSVLFVGRRFGSETSANKHNPKTANQEAHLCGGPNKNVIGKKCYG